jgi:hypothetical protein
MRRHRNFRAAWVFGVAGGERELPPAPALGLGVPDYPGFSHSAFLVSQFQLLPFTLALSP